MLLGGIARHPTNSPLEFLTSFQSENNQPTVGIFNQHTAGKFNLKPIPAHTRKKGGQANVCFITITDYRTSEKKRSMKEFANRFVAIDWLLQNGYEPCRSHSNISVYYNTFFTDRSRKIAITVND